MKLKYMTDVSKAAIKKGIKDLSGIVANANERAQTLAVAVIEHDREHGDCTLAVDLVNTLPNAEQRRWMLQFLKFFGAITIETDKGRAKNAKHRDPRSNGYRPADLDGAKANMWFEPEQGGWFAGPPRDLFVPGTIGDVGENVVRFGDQLSKRLTGTKDRGDGTQVPFYTLTDEQRQVADRVVIGLKRLGSLMSATENAEELTIELKKTEGLIASLSSTLDAVAPTDETEQQSEVGEAVNA